MRIKNEMTHNNEWVW